MSEKMIKNRATKIAANTRPVRHEPGTGAVREGCALLQGLAACGICGRKLAVFYQGPSKATPGYYCTGTGALVNGHGDILYLHGRKPFKARHDGTDRYRDK